MFNNIGGKLKILAWVVFICGAACSIISGIVLLSTEETLFEGIILLIAGPIASWVGSFTTYAFGELIESNKIQESYLRKISKQLETPQPQYKPQNIPEVKSTTSEANICPACLKEVPATKHLCPHCGNSIK